MFLKSVFEDVQQKDFGSVGTKGCCMSHKPQSSICICLAPCSISFFGWFCYLKILSFIEALPVQFLDVQDDVSLAPKLIFWNVFLHWER